MKWDHEPSTASLSLLEDIGKGTFKDHHALLESCKRGNVVKDYSSVDNSIQFDLFTLSRYSHVNNRGRLSRVVLNVGNAVRACYLELCDLEITLIDMSPNYRRYVFAFVVLARVWHN